MRISIIGLLLLIGSFSLVNEASACHALALVNFQVDDTTDPTGVFVDASSSDPTCGCSEYWMDIEVRCVGDAFDGAQFNPGFYGPLSTYPYYQSNDMLKPDCIVQAYPTVFISYADLCPGQDYTIRARENHNGDVGPWTTPSQVITAPGTLPPMTVSLTATPPEVCPGDPTEIEAIQTGGCGLAVSYEWFSAPDNNGSPQLPWSPTGVTTNPATFNPTDPTWYRLVATDQCSNETANDEVFVDMLPPPDPGTASISDILVCEGDEIDLDVAGASGDIQWQISSDPPTTWTNIAGATGPNTSVTITDDQCFRVEVSGCGNTYTNVVCVENEPIPNAVFSGNDACVGEEINFTNQSSGNIGTFEWIFDDGNTSNGLLVSHTYSSPGDYEVALVITSPQGCTDTATQVITINPNPEVSFDVDPTCLLSISDFNNTSTIDPFNGSTIDSWDWDLGDGNTSSVQNPQHGYVDENEYEVTLIATSNYGCTDTATGVATIYPLPDADFNFDDNCITIFGDFEDSSTVSNEFTENNIVEWDWDFGDGGNATDQNPSYAYSDIGDYEITLTVTTDNGCSNSSSDSIMIVDFANADFTNTPSEGTIPLEVDFFNNSSGGTSYYWDFGNGVTDFSNTPDDISIYYYQPGVYTVTFEVDNGICTSEDTTLIIVNDIEDIEFNLPNIITPNGDGQNDKLHFDLSNVARVEVRIYNRWGNLVGLISRSENQEGWDGRDRTTNQPVSDGVYYYTYEFHALNGEVVTGHQYFHVKRD